jgi:hypothetical protein
VLLFTDHVGLGQPPFDLGIDLVGSAKTKCVEHVARGEDLDSRET